MTGAGFLGEAMTMNRVKLVVLALLSAMSTAGAVGANTTDLAGDWSFRKAEGEWTTVRVPHDWAIGCDFDQNLPCGTGMLPWQAKGEYRRKVTVSESDAQLLKDGGEAYLEFDGVMARPAVKVNGQPVGGVTYGYLGFTLRVGRTLRAGENEILVSADTTRQTSRFYCGGGIYRGVRLKILPKGHVVPGSVVIRVTEVSKESATVVAEWERSDGQRERRVETIADPRLWDVIDPHLYAMEVGGETYRYGIRTCRFTADDGFHLNGRRLQLKGVCLHSDLGLLGMAFNVDAQRRQLALMRDMGVNAIRTSHNCPDPKLLDLCDEMGFVVWDECFDKWDSTAGWEGHENLDEYVECTLRSFVRRDRNHPCVVAWSIGNEIDNQTEKYFSGVERSRCRRYRQAILEEDPTRQVGIAAWRGDTIDAFADLDVTGWNYARRYMPMKRKYPQIPMLYTESGSSYSDYGYYGNGQPAANRGDIDLGLRRTCGYDHTAASYSDIPDVEFWRMEKDSWMAGEFVWTGIDYLGEPAPWGGEFLKGDKTALARSSTYGIVDLTVFPKDRFWLYRSYWNKESETVHILPHWNWEGRAEKVTVMVYTSGDEAELFLNGKSLGRRAKDRSFDDYPLDHTDGDASHYRICDRYRLMWKDVPYAPGELKAVGYRGGRAIGEETKFTAGPVAKYACSLDPYSRPGDSIAFYRVAAVDDKGVLDPWNMDRVEISISGDGEFVAAGNGNPHERTGFASRVQPLFYGRAMVAVRRTGPGEIRVTAVKREGR